MSLRILQVSTADSAGGAEQVAMNLHRGFRRAGDDATLAVGYRAGAEDGVVLMRNHAYRGIAGIFERAVGAAAERTPPRARDVLRRVALLGQPRRFSAVMQGREDFDMPATDRLLELAGGPPDVLHCHNLHGGYFDLRQLATLSARIPTFLTLHDMWSFTGHCAYSLGCDRWHARCGACPHLDVYPAIRRDASAENVERKREIYRRCRLHVASPSKWLLDMARESALGEGAVEWRLVPYGIDLDVFHPRDRAGSRRRLGIAQGARVLLYAANLRAGNPFKDYTTVDEAVRRIDASLVDEDLVFLVLGGAEQRVVGRTRFVPFVKDRQLLAEYYRASDLFLHAATEDNFPNTVLEAQACGTPVIATAVGGIPEQIEHGVTGILVPPRGALEMANAVLSIVRDRARLEAMRASAIERARARYDLRRHVVDYRSWFSDVIAARRPSGAAALRT